MQKRTYDLSIVFYENLLYLCIGKINNNRYEAKTRYTSLSDNRGYYIFHSLTIEIVAVLLASMVSFQVYNKIGIRMSLLPFVMVAGYVVLKLLYHVCVWATGCIIELLSHKKVALVNEPISIGTTTSSSNMEDIQKKRMELFHYEYQRTALSAAKRKGRR